MRELCCQYQDCGVIFVSIAGWLPDVCPLCGRPALLSTRPGRAVAHPPGEPRVSYALTYNDKRLLHSLAIEPDD